MKAIQGIYMVGINTMEAYLGSMEKGITKTKEKENRDNSWTHTCIGRNVLN